MDSAARSRGDRPTNLNADPPSHFGIGFAEFENKFLSLLASDVGRARALFKQLLGWKRLPPAERPRRDRLIGRYFYVTGKFPKTITWTLKALAGYRKTGDRQGANQCLRTLLSAYMYTGRYERARSCAREILEAPDCPVPERLKVHINLGNLEHRLNRFGPALEHFSEAMQLLGRDEELTAVVSYNMANVLVCVNRFGEAKTHYRAALKRFRERKMLLYEAYALQAQGYLYSILGQYGAAESFLNRARTLYLEGSDRTGAALCDLDLFHQRIQLNRFAEALSEADGLMETFDQLDLGYEKGLLCYDAARASLALDDPYLCEAYLDGACAIFKAEENGHYLALCDMLRAELLVRDDQREQAVAHIDAARGWFVKQRLAEFELRALTFKFLVLKERLTPRGFRRLRSLVDRPLRPDTRVRALLLLSEYWHERGQLKKAIHARFEAVLAVEESRASIVSSSLRESFFEDKSQIYEPLVEWLFQWKDPTASRILFRTLELSRSRQFSERLSETAELRPILHSGEPAILELTELETRLAQLDRKQASLAHELNRPEAETEAMTRAYGEVGRRLGELKRRMRDHDRLGFYFPIDLSPEELRRHLPPRHLVVSYFLGTGLGGGALYRLEMDNRGLKSFQLPFYPTFLTDLNELYLMLANRVLGQTHRIHALLEGLSGFLWPARLKGNDHVIFVPHKQLDRFPFALLRAGERFLLETHRISQCPNIPALYFSLKKMAPTLRKPLFFFSDHGGDPAARERHLLLRQYPKARTIANFGQPGLRKALAASDFIHFAGHCVFNRSSPDASYLQLAEKRLPLEHIQSLKLNRPFINLAACESGFTATLAGNEPHGFVVGLFAAGAVTILAALWDLDDRATGKWMNLFYRNLKQGFASAYRAACLAMMKDEPEPYFWGGFCLFGKP